MANWITEGVPFRAPGVTPRSIRHLAVDGPIDVSLWCTGNRARETVNPHGTRFCRECLRLAQDAIEAGTLEPSDVYDWPIPRELRQLTKEESSVVVTLQRLAKRWPDSIMLVSMDGSLSVVDKTAYHAGNEDRFNGAERQDACVLAYIEGVPINASPRLKPGDF